VLAILDADPKTDWSNVDLEALRQHLIDMNEVTLRADAGPKQIDGGQRAHACRHPTDGSGMGANDERTARLDR
jgi:hypothetical protein